MDGSKSISSFFPTSNFLMYLKIWLFFGAVVSQKQEDNFMRVSNFSRHTNLTIYSPLRPPVRPLVKSQLDCARVCTGNFRCVGFAFSPGYRECILAGLPAIRLPKPLSYRRDSRFFLERNGCSGEATVYMKPARRCVRKLHDVKPGGWQNYSDVCSRSNPNNRLLELPTPNSFHYTLSVVFASDFFPIGKMWIGARGRSNGTDYNINWVTRSLPVNSSFWDWSVTPTRFSGDYHYDDDNDDDGSGLFSGILDSLLGGEEKDDNNKFMDEPDMCGYLEKTRVGVFLRMGECTAVGGEHYFALCRIQTL